MNDDDDLHVLPLLREQPDPAAGEDRTEQFESVRAGLLADMQAAHQARADDGWVDARGDDPDLPAAVRDIVERHAAHHEGRTSADYLVTYRYNPMPDATDAYDVMVTPALFALGEGTMSIEVDHAQQVREQLAEAAARLTEFGDTVRDNLQRAAEAAAPAVNAFMNAFAPLHDVITTAFGRITYLTDGLPPGPVVDTASARAALAYAESTMVLRRPRKQARRGAKRAFLAVKRHLPADERRALRKVPMRKFGSLPTGEHLITAAD